MYLVRKATKEDREVMYEVLALELVDYDKPEAGKNRDVRRLYNNIDLALSEDMAIVLESDGVVVGVQLLQDRNGVLAIIVHSNILVEHRGKYGSGLLLDKVVNDIFVDRDVYVLESKSTFANMVEYMGSNLYKIKPSVGKIIKQFLLRGE